MNEMMKQYQKKMMSTTMTIVWVIELEKRKKERPNERTNEMKNVLTKKIRQKRLKKRKECVWEREGMNVVCRVHFHEISLYLEGVQFRHVKAKVVASKVLHRKGLPVWSNHQWQIL